MTQKTNQFNLRTKRYNESDIRRFNESDNYEVYQMSLKDKFGDYGIIGSAIIEIQSRKVFIDSFILSCRVIGRTAETAGDYPRPSGEDYRASADAGVAVVGDRHLPAPVGLLALGHRLSRERLATGAIVGAGVAPSQVPAAQASNSPPAAQALAEAPMPG